MKDEFEIKATGHPTEPDRIWTRSSKFVAARVADDAVVKLGYGRAEVVNTYGGHRSSPLYVAQRTG